MKNQNKINKQKDLKRNKGIRSTIIGAFIVLALSALYLYFKPSNVKESENESSKTYETVFKKEGQLAFINKNNNDTMKSIDIEIADNDEKRTQGLMWRRSIPDSVGMLFIFEQERPLSFWMKNTYISLDIVFVNKASEIVTIQNNTVPQSELSIPSNKPAQYAIEVIAGFCNKYKIKKGDKIKYRLINSVN
jgi:uncharacterized membrane protein (UPF0127 family)